MFEDYFDLQLRVAAQFAARARVSLEVGVETCTNLRRRLNLLGDAGLNRWSALLARIGDAAGDHSAALTLCLEEFTTRPRFYPPITFGCFSYDPPDANGALRIHFMASPDGARSPLAVEAVEDRRQELRELFAHLDRSRLNAKSVRGLSWLYNVEPYRRLFPLAYRLSVAAPRFPVNMNGSSTWGQALTWRQAVKPEVRDIVLANLSKMKVDEPWLVFPLRAMVATCPIDDFHSWLA
jgi:hypothetical protein